MTVYNKGLLNAAPQGWKFWGTSMWAGMGRIRGVRKGHGGIWSSEVRSGGKTAEEVAQLGVPVFRQELSVQLGQDQVMHTLNLQLLHAVQPSR